MAVRQPSLAELPWLPAEAAVQWLVIDALTDDMPSLAMYGGAIAVCDSRSAVPLLEHCALLGCRYGWRWHRSTLARLLTHDLPLAAGTLTGLALKQGQALQHALEAVCAAGPCEDWDDPAIDFYDPPSTTVALVFAGVRRAGFDRTWRRVYLDLDNGHRLVLDDPAAWSFYLAAWTRAIPAAVLAPLSARPASQSQSPSTPSPPQHPFSVVSGRPASHPSTPVCAVEAPLHQIAVGPNAMGVVTLEVRSDGTQAPSVVRVQWSWLADTPESRWETVVDAKPVLGLWATLAALLPRKLWVLHSPYACWRQRPKAVLQTVLGSVIRAVVAVDATATTLETWTLDAQKLVRPFVPNTKPASPSHVCVSWLHSLAPDGSTLRWVPTLNVRRSSIPIASPGAPVTSGLFASSTVRGARGLTVAPLGQFVATSSGWSMALDMCSKAELSNTPQPGHWNVSLDAVVQNHSLLPAVQRALRCAGVSTTVLA